MFPGSVSGAKRLCGQFQYCFTGVRCSVQSLTDAAGAWFASGPVERARAGVASAPFRDGQGPDPDLRQPAETPNRDRHRRIRSGLARVWQKRKSGRGAARCRTPVTGAENGAPGMACGQGEARPVHGRALSGRLWPAVARFRVSLQKPDDAGRSREIGPANPGLSSVNIDEIRTGAVSSPYRFNLTFVAD